ncbi:MAG TPA: adhesin [Desulfobacteraceae bacterium]|nr:adhesin [Desulfobacteraceae bacterium]|tara:strand:+ start:180 stop:491 length:312 start_codon:yes stop_codon:yes gene_type:complete
MINVSKLASEQVKAYFDGKDVQPVRIFLNSGGCGGPSLAMALDQINDTDAVFTHEGIDYIMEKSLLAQASPVTIDYSGMGFRLESSLAPAGGCASCGSGGCGA